MALEVPELDPQLTRGQRLALFRTIYAARRIDDREIAGKRQNKVFFQINGAGHEAIQAAAARCLRPGYDWFFLYYRDRALAYGLGVTALVMLWRRHDLTAALAGVVVVAALRVLGH